MARNLRTRRTAPPRKPRKQRPPRQRGGLAGSKAGGRTERLALPHEARVEYHTAFARSAKVGTYGLAATGTALALGYATTKAAGAIGSAIHGKPEEVVKSTTRGDYVKDEAGNTTFIPSEEYLKLLNELGLDHTGSPFPIQVGQQESDVKEGFQDAVETVFSPLTILAVALGIALIFYFKGKK